MTLHGNKWRYTELLVKCSALWASGSEPTSSDVGIYVYETLCAHAFREVLAYSLYCIYVSMACRYFPTHHRTWLQHYDSI